MPQEQTPFYGKNTNHPFTLYPKDSYMTVKTLRVWYGAGSGNAEGLQVLKGIRLTWWDGYTQEVYNHRKDDDTEVAYNFRSGETADWSIRAAWRIDRLQFESSEGNSWNAGGGGGTLYPHIADGYLIGFEGSAGWEIDYLSLKYRTR